MLPKYCNLYGLEETRLSSVGECAFDQGGYFVVNGAEKVIISQERIAENEAFVFNNQKTNNHQKDVNDKN